MILTILEAFIKLCGLAEYYAKWKSDRECKKAAEQIADEPITKKELVDHYRNDADGV